MEENEIDTTRDMEPEERILWELYNFDDARSYGPMGAYQIARETAEDIHPELSFPTYMEDFEEQYGYDIDDPPKWAEDMYDRAASYVDKNLKTVVLPEIPGLTVKEQPSIGGGWIACDTSEGKKFIITADPYSIGMFYVRGNGIDDAHVDADGVVATVSKICGAEPITEGVDGKPMVRKVVRFNNEDSAYDAMNGLDNFAKLLVDKSNAGIIDRVKYSKDGCDITIEGAPDDVSFVQQFVEETDMDAVVNLFEAVGDTTEAKADTFASDYGSGNYTTHENSASGFYPTEKRPLPWAILNGDVAALDRLAAGTVEPFPKEPWNCTGFSEDDGGYDINKPDYDEHVKYIYSIDDDYQKNFYDDWCRVVGDADNQEALRWMLKKYPDFWVCDMDFYNAVAKGYAKDLLLALLMNFYCATDESEEEFMQNRLGWWADEGDTFDGIVRFLQGK